MIDNKRDIDKLIIHCSATPEGREVSVATITKWHTDPPPYGRGWTDIGYHYIIHLDGEIGRGRDENIQGAHCYGQNKNSIGICYVGGVNAENKYPKDTRTKEQRHAMKILIESLQDEYPGATVHCHNEFANKACPSFKIKDLYPVKTEPAKTKPTIDIVSNVNIASIFSAFCRKYILNLRQKINIPLFA